MVTTFNDSFSKEIYEQTYRFGDEDINKTQKRVADALAAVEKDPEKWSKEFLWAMENFKFVPGGRITSNAGTGLKGTSLINCHVSGASGKNIDSMEGILGELQRQAMILKSEGGYGVCSDFMRPRGGYISGIANSSPGAVKMLEMWDKQSDVITSGSGQKSEKGKVKIRKGAQMVTMSCWHPDILEFITAKQTPGRLSKFNMSVLVTDEFMTAVKGNLPWNLEFPDYEQHPEEYHDHWDGYLSHWKERGFSTKIYKSFETANELWDIILHSTYTRNEPGVLFVDTMNKMNNLYYTESINATNPCLTSDTWICTNQCYGGWKQIKDLVGKQFETFTFYGTFKSTEQGFWSNGVKDVYELTCSGTNSVTTIKATRDHRFLRRTGTFPSNLYEWVTVAEIQQRKEYNKPTILINATDNTNFFVDKIEYAGQEEVFDCTIPDRHYFNANGLVSHNCG